MERRASRQAGVEVRLLPVWLFSHSRGSSMTFRTVLMLTSSLALATPACGEAFNGGGSPPPAPDGSSPPPSIDAGNHDSTAPDGSSSDAEPEPDAVGHDSAPTADAATSCLAPSFPSGDQGLGCARAVCPTGTVCAQADSDNSATAICVTIPPECVGHPTCGCMEATAEDCLSSGPPRFGCQEVEDGGASYLDFPCGCA
jgi:hypothetical protein